MSTSTNSYNASSGKFGSVISENELRGLKYGLSRSQYLAAPDPVKFFIGLEISVADYVGFPLLEKLCGVNNENLNELENSCGAGKVQFLIRGESTPSPDSQTEPLHLFIVASSNEILERATVVASDLCNKVRKSFELHNTQVLHRIAEMVKNFSISPFHSLIPQAIRDTTSPTFTLDLDSYIAEIEACDVLVEKAQKIKTLLAYVSASPSEVLPVDVENVQFGNQDEALQPKETDVAKSEIIAGNNNEEVDDDFDDYESFEAMLAGDGQSASSHSSSELGNSEATSEKRNAKSVSLLDSLPQLDSENLPKKRKVMSKVDPYDFFDYNISFYENYC